MTEKQRNEEIEKSNDADMVAGINTDTEANAIKSQEAQSKGETVESKNIETQRENDDQKENDGVLAKINGFMSNMFGTKTKRDNEEENKSKNLGDIDAKAQEIEGKASELKAAMEEFASNIEKPDKGESITPKVMVRNNLGSRQTNASSTIYIVEKPVNVGGDGSVGGGMGGGGSTPSFTNSNNNTSDIMKRVQKVMLQI